MQGTARLNPVPSFRFFNKYGIISKEAHRVYGALLSRVLVPTETKGGPMASNIDFEAVVQKPSAAGLTSKGVELPIRAWMPDRAGAISVSAYQALQDAYGGELDIVHKDGKVEITKVGTFCQYTGIARESRTLADRIKRYLGVPATVQ
jgi:hypothetical protein